MKKQTRAIQIILFLFYAFRISEEKMFRLNYREKEKEILDTVLESESYDSRIRPAPVMSPQMNSSMLNSPTQVNVNTYLRSIDKIDDYKMEYSVQLTFRQDWLDPRLAYPNVDGKLKYLTMTDPDKVWMPDTFFQNEKTGHFHNIIVPNVYIRIFPNGKVLYSIRISLTLSCPMDLKLYPLDRQQCEMRIASYGWTTDDLIYHWKATDPVQIVQDLNLPRFKLEQFQTSYCNTITNTGEYSCLKVLLVFKREFSYYLLTIYVPSCMLVIVSWVSFWLDSRSVPARVALGVTTLLTMSTQTAGVNRSLPPVAYTKAIDVWSGACVIFVFSALLEFAFVNYASRSDRRKGKLKQPANPFLQNANAYYDPDDHLDDDDDDEDMIDYNEKDTRLSSSQQPQVWKDANGHLVLYPPPSQAGAQRENCQKRSSHQCSPSSFQPPQPGQGRHHVTRLASTDRLLDTSSPSKLAVHEERGTCHGCRAGKGNQARTTPCSYLSKKFPLRSKRIDVVARIVFPIVFATFNLCYWIFYLSAERETLSMRG